MAALEDVFPPSPRPVPEGLTAPSRAYRRHAWLATLGLLTFVTLYLGLTGYFAWVVNRLLVNALLHHGNVVAAAFLSLPALFFLGFLVRGLFVVKHAKDPTSVEVTEPQQPLLFAFLHRLAAEASAPRPHRVYLSARVNACVFYDLSFRNLIIPSKKNLEIGLGLVNVLTLDELKAVLAHEYGHFAQRTMAVGRWVYISQQIAGHVIVSRGIFDRFLTGLSRTDVRIAWVGWIMRVFVWALRAVLDTGYRLVVIAHRALSREMELQADRVAVAVSGSDSLVHALHRLGPGDEAWDEAIQFAVAEAHAGRQVDDLFELQSASLEHLRRVFAEPDYGKTPVRPPEAAAHRVFDLQLAQPPRMWLTHPPNRDREENAKATYLPSTLDPRDAWALFSEVPELRKQVTAQLLEKAKVGAQQPATGTALERFARRYQRASLNPAYHGVYLGRSIAAHVKDVGAMMGPSVGDGREGVLDRLRSLYPAPLRGDLKSYRERREEEQLLEGLADGVLTAPGGVIRYRGRELRRKELPGVITKVKDDRKDLEQRLLAHDQACRAAHRDAAALLGQGWPEHHRALVALLHFSTHTLRSISDAHSYLHHVLGIVLADGSVSGSERKRLLSVATDLRGVLGRAWDAKAKVELPPDVAARFDEAGGWEVLAQELKLGHPTAQNLGDWLQIVDGWANGAVADLRVLCDVTLDTLLEAEEQLASGLEDGQPLPPAPANGSLPPRYDVCLIGGERARQKRLGWWDRFQTADGFIPGALRAAVAGILLIPALMAGSRVGSSTLHILNALDTPVTVAVGDVLRSVNARSAVSVDLDPKSGLRIVTKTRDGRLVEQFDADVGGGMSHVAYNVAAAAPLVHWTAVYGPATPGPERQLGARRWLEADEDVVFAEPPHTVETSHGAGATRSVLQAELDDEPALQVSLVPDKTEANAMIAAHLRFDALDAQNFGTWLALGQQQPGLRALIVERGQGEPRSVILARALLDSADGEEHAKRCAELDAKAASSPQDGDLLYLSVRCQPGGEARDAAFEKAYAAHPDNPWLALALTDDFARRGQWKQALAAWKTVLGAEALRPYRGLSTLEAERTRRAARAAGHAEGSAPAHVKGPLQFELRVEGPEQKDDWPTATAHRALNQGRLNDALRAIGNDHGRDRLLALAGASDGASDALIDQALALSDAAQDIAPALAGLAARQGRSPAGFLAKSRLPVELEQMTPKQLEKLAAASPLVTRGQILTFGCLALGKQAPAEWRQQVRALLFPSERPYFRSP